MNLRICLLLACISLVSCGKKSDDNNSSRANPQSNKLTGLENDDHGFKLSRRYDINSIFDFYNESHIENYINTLNNKELEIKLKSSESLDPSGCYVEDQNLAEIRNLNGFNSKTFRVHITLKQNLAPVYVYCPISSK